MPKIGVATKQPAEILDWDIEYDEFFEGIGGGVISGTPTAEVTYASAGSVDDLVLGPGLLPPVDVIGTDVAKIWIGGGISGRTYKVTVTMTDGQRVVESDFDVKVKEV